MYKMTNNGGGTEILLYSLIEGGHTAGNILRQLKDAQDGKITLRINSDGGEVFDAIALWNCLKDRGVEVIIDGICASAASIIAMAGQTITMMQGSMMMIHNPVTAAFGDSETLKGAAETLDLVRDQIAGIYCTRTGLSREEILTLMDAETWMSAEEAVARGFADRVEPLQEEPAPEEPADPAAAERERIRALDELMTPERAGLINEAKYITMKTAQEIALDLLKSEARRKTPAVNSFSMEESRSVGMSHIAGAIERITRGGRNAG